MNNQKSFRLLRMEPELSRHLHLQYGDNPNYPPHFILTLTPEYVSRQTGQKVTELYYFEMCRYAEQNAETLKQIAMDGMEKGSSGELLR